MLLKKIIKIILDIFINVYVRTVLLIVSIVPGYPNNPITSAVRRLVLRLIDVRVAGATEITEGIYVHHFSKLRIGSNSSLGKDLKIWNFEPVLIGNGMLCSHNVTLIAGTHEVNASRDPKRGPITIGDNVWIGANVVIVGPSDIGDNVIIGANSFVTGNFKSDQIIGGSPAKWIRNVQG